MGKPGPRSAVHREIARVHDLKALVLDINEVRKALKLLAWERGDKELWRLQGQLKTPLVKIKKALQAHHTSLLGEIEENE